MIVAAGNIYREEIYFTEALPSAGEVIRYKRKESRLKGSPIYFLEELNQLNDGLEMCLVGCIGRDGLKLEELKEKGINVHLKVDEERNTGRVIFIQDREGRRLGTYELGANELSYFDLLEVDPSVLRISGIWKELRRDDEKVISILEKLKERGTLVWIDGLYEEDLLSKVTKQTDIFSLNVDELRSRFLYSSQPLEELIHSFALNPNQLLLIHADVNGAYARKGNQIYHARTNPVKGDAVGAGDVFDANFCYYHLIEGEAIRESLEKSTKRATEFVENG